MTTKKVGALATARRRITIVAAAALASAGMAVSSSQAAQAAASQCPDNNLCVWKDAGYKGPIMVTIGSQGNLPDFNNKISSVWNRTNRNVCLAGERNFKGGAVLVTPGAASGRLGAYNDWASSIRVGCAA